MQRIASIQTCSAKVTKIIQTLRPRYLIDVGEKSPPQDLAHTIYGPSPTPESVPIFVLHDFLGTKNNWGNVSTKLMCATRKSVIAVDARNHGDSPHNKSHNYFSLVSDVQQLMAKYIIEKCIIVGHGMGGRTGMLMALNKPTCIAGLVVVDISPVSTSYYTADYLPKMMEVLMSVNFQGMGLNEAKTAARKTILDNNLFQNEAEIQDILMNIGKLPDESFGWKYNLDNLKEQFNNIVDFPYMQCLTQYQGPTLFVAGKLSQCIPTEDFAGIRKLFPLAHLQYIEEVDHNVHNQDPDGLVSTITKFLDRDVITTPT